MKKTKEQKVMEVVKRFIADNEITCEDTVFQCDWVAENSLNLVADLCDIVGYCKDEDK